MKDRKKSPFGFWATIATALFAIVVAYPLSIGPTWWLIGRVERSAAISPGAAETFYYCCRIVYAPLTFTVMHSPKTVQDARSLSGSLAVKS